MNRAPDASIVICAYSMERWNDLVVSVASVSSQRHPPAEIIVVIDRNDELLSVASANLAGVRVVANENQAGISGARNTGVSHARGGVVVFLDDDAIADPDWLDSLLAPYEDERVIGVGGQIIPLWRFGRPGWFPAEFNWVVGCSYLGLPETRSKVRNPIGASLSVRRSDLIALGGFDHTMGRVSEQDHKQVSGTADETELCIRATKLWPERYWVYEPRARVHHVVPQSRLSWSFFVGRCRMEGAAKALLTEIAGQDQSLSSEQFYVRAVLPRAVRRELARAARGDVSAVRRAAAIMAGLAITAATYVQIRLERSFRRLRDGPLSAA